MCNALGTVRRVWKFKITRCILAMELERQLYNIVKEYQDYNVKFLIERTDEYITFAVSIPATAESKYIDLMCLIKDRINNIKRMLMY